MDTDIGAGSPEAEDSSDGPDTAPLPVLNAMPGMFSDPGPFATPAPDFVQPPFVEQPVAPEPYPSAFASPAPAAEQHPKPAAEPAWGSGVPTSTVDFSSWEDKPERSKRPLIIGGAIAAVVVLVGGMVAVFMGGSSDDVPAETTTAAPQTPVSTRDSDAETRLLSMLPVGYAPSACKAVEPANEAVAQFKCGRSDDPDGPVEASYSLVRDKSSLSAGLSRLMKRSTVVMCPGRIQSPGPWRRNATPDLVSGTVFCGSAQGHPMVGWTDEERLLLSETRSGVTGPTLDQLYAWWSSHS